MVKLGKTINLWFGICFTKLSQSPFQFFWGLLSLLVSALSLAWLKREVDMLQVK